MAVAQTEVPEYPDDPEMHEYLCRLARIWDLGRVIEFEQQNCDPED